MGDSLDIYTKCKAFLVARVVYTFPKMVVSPITSTSGDCRARNIAIASSTETTCNSQWNKELIDQAVKVKVNFVRKSKETETYDFWLIWITTRKTNKNWEPDRYVSNRCQGRYQLWSSLVPFRLPCLQERRDDLWLHFFPNQIRIGIDVAIGVENTNTSKLAFFFFPFVYWF